MKKVLKNKKVIIYSLLALLFLLIWICGSLKNDTSLARYTSSASGGDEVTVAKWSIIGLTEKGKDLSLAVDFNEKLKSNDTGSWYFEISNASEVSAMISKDSTIKAELLHNDFVGKVNNKWDFLEGVNPITFSVDIISKPIDEIVYYEYNSNKLTSSQYEALDDAEKPNYEQKIYSIDSEDVTTIFTSSGTDELKSEIVDGKVVYYAEYSLSGLADAVVELGLNEKEKNKTFRLNWNVTDSSGTGNVNHYKYYKYYLSETAPNNTTTFFAKNIINNMINNNNYSFCKTNELSENKYRVTYEDNGHIVTKEMYLIAQEIEFTDYFLFGSGEPVFTIDSRRVKFSDLNQNDKNSVANRKVTSSDAETLYEEIQLYLEKIEYDQYSLFNKEYSDFLKSQGYLQYGLSCSVVFNLKVNQVD